MWALDPMFRGPGASARVILVLNQNQNASDMFWDAQAVKSISNLNLGPQISIRSAVNSFCAPKQFPLILLDSCPDQSDQCDHQFENRARSSRKKGRSLLCTNLQFPWALRWCGWTPRQPILPCGLVSRPH